MARVLKIACGLMGVLLLTMVGVMGAGRYEKGGLQLISIVYRDGNKWMLGWLTSDFRQMRPLGQYCGTPYWFSELAAKDEYTAYFEDCAEKPRNGLNIKRVNLITGMEDGIVFNMVPYTMNKSPNYRWLVYLAWKDHDDGRWVRITPDGQEALDLTANVPAQIMPHEESPAFFSPDGKWVYVMGKTRANSQFDIYRIRIDGNEWENLTTQVDENLFFWNDQQSKPDGLPLLIGQEYFLMDFEDHTLRQFQPSGQDKMASETIVAEFPTKNLKVISVSGDWSGLQGISTIDNTTLWEAPDRYFVWSSPEEEWLYFTQVSIFVVEQMRWDGTSRRIIDPPIGMITRRWANDGEWLIFSMFNSTSNQHEINRMSPDGQIMETLFISPYESSLISISPDEEWLLFTNSNTVYAMYPDGSKLTQIHPLDSYTFDHIVRFLPTINHHWQPPILAVIALTLIATPIMFSRLDFRPHPPAPSPRSAEGRTGLEGVGKGKFIGHTCGCERHKEGSNEWETTVSMARRNCQSSAEFEWVASGTGESDEHGHHRSGTLSTRGGGPASGGGRTGGECGAALAAASGG